MDGAPRAWHYTSDPTHGQENDVTTTNIRQPNNTEGGYREFSCMAFLPC